ncbi:MAG: aminoacetone oxidase family FAD-binding enzyme [Candidatus Omnitrophica bacterium]|nr:aminoacetone oxidase family FAD-binding enzyme [Candidatus Omnitrophota bacterium]
MGSYDTIIIGGGAAGIVAAITARRNGRSVLLCEKMPKLGKKLLVTGAGRCNLLNERMDASFYNPEARELVGTVFKRYGKGPILDFFRELGLHTWTDEAGRIFPVTQQAASVLKVLEIELSRLEIPVRLNAGVRDIRAVSGAFEVRTGSGERFVCARVILCAGGKSYPALGADGGGYALAQKCGHTLVEPVPCVVPLLVKDPWCHALQGQRVRAKVRAYLRDRPLGESLGELLFTQYGLSGTVILDISREISIAANRDGQKNIFVIADLVPWLTEDAVGRELTERMEKGVPPEAILEGLLPHKFSPLFQEIARKKDIAGLVKGLKHRSFQVSGTRGWNESEFTAGGVPASEVDPGTLGSKRKKGLHLAGEVLDVQGARGGYNLAWAWASGMMAGASVSG